MKDVIKRKQDRKEKKISFDQRFFIYFSLVKKKISMYGNLRGKGWDLLCRRFKYLFQPKQKYSTVKKECIC